MDALRLGQVLSLVGGGKKSSLFHLTAIPEPPQVRYNPIPTLKAALENFPTDACSQDCFKSTMSHFISHN